MTSRNAWAYGRAAMTRSIARFIFDVATISIVRVILRVFSTDLMRPFSSRPFAMTQIGECEVRWTGRCLTNCRFDRGTLVARAGGLLVRFDAPAQIRFELFREILRLAQPVTHLWVPRRHELEKAALPIAHVLRRHVV